jgi:hypothetical protein
MAINEPFFFYRTSTISVFGGGNSATSTHRFSDFYHLWDKLLDFKSSLRIGNLLVIIVT